MITESLPVDVFIKIRFQDVVIQEVVDNWPIEMTDVQKIVIHTFEDMGIYSVTPQLENLVINKITDILKYSPEIQGMIMRAKELERKRKKQHKQNIISE